mmetsp:Transcript_47955/g.116783  ORF Transcript_47955/g.116783 Transcript_47955/m.116783 type:complete len:321 (-) Transcript_47955:177-1139(-)
MAGPRPTANWKYKYYVCLDIFLTNMLKCFDAFLRAAGPIFVCFAITLVSGVVYSWFTFVLPNLAEKDTVGYYFHVTIAVWLTYNVAWNYLKTVLTPPGQPPEDWGQDIEGQGGELAGRHPDGSKRWCKKCKRPKPPRTHHCSVCRKCVLKMDHHCPWVSNCVGFKNYRTFFLFMAYLWVGCVYVMATSGPAFFRFIRMRGIIAPGHTYVVMSFILAMSVSLAVGLLLAWHIYLVLTSQTTIEWYGNRMKAQECRKRNIPFVNEWDVGYVENIAMVLGSGSDPFNVFWWLLPTTRPPFGDGTWFNSRTEMLQKQIMAHEKD